MKYPGITAFALFLFHGTAFGSSADTVSIGLLVGKSSDTGIIGGAMLAIREANRESSGRTFFKLVIRSMEGSWGTGSKQAVDLIFKYNARALVVSSDGRNAHLAEQAAAKAQVPVINTLSGDPSLSRAFVPWYFSVIPDYPSQAKILLEHFRNTISSGAIVVAEDTYDQKLASESFKKACSDAGFQSPVILHIDNINTIKNLTAEISSKKNCTIIFFGSHENALRFRSLLQESSKNFEFIFASPPGAELYAGEDHAAREGMIQPAIGNPERIKKFSMEFSREFGYRPGAAACYAYDGIRLAARAISLSSAKGPALADAIKSTEYQGITGHMRFDRNGNSTGAYSFKKISDEDL